MTIYSNNPQRQANVYNLEFIITERGEIALDQESVGGFDYYVLDKISDHSSAKIKTLASMMDENPSKIANSLIRLKSKGLIITKQNPANMPTM